MLPRCGCDSCGVDEVHLSVISIKENTYIQENFEFDGIRSGFVHKKIIK